MSTLDARHRDPFVVHSLGRLDLVAKVIVEGLRQGEHRSRRRGFSTEFSDFNPYVPGDDLRFIDWRLYARTDRLFVKSFEAETNLEVMLLMDASRSMAWRWQDRITKLEYATNLLAALGMLHIRQHDLVGLLLHDAHDLHHLPPRSRRNQLDAIFATLDAVEPDAGDNFPATLASLADYRRHRGRLILCSDLEEDPDALAQALESLTGHQDEVILLHILDQAEVELPFTDATHLRDSETGELIKVDLDTLKREHAAEVAAFQEHWRTTCTRWGIRYLPLHTGHAYVDVIYQLMDLLQQAR